MKRRNIPLDWISFWAARGFIAAAMAMPYPQRVRFFGQVMARLVGPISSYNNRVRENLGLVWPDMSEPDVHLLCQSVTDNMGRTTIENYSLAEFSDHCARLPLGGPGWEAFLEAHEAGRPTVFFSGHFGNYAAPRMALRAKGYSVGVLYRPFNNPFFERYHRTALEEIGTTFARGAKGTSDMVRHLKGGNSIAIMADQHVHNGAPLTFFGLPAATSTSAARLAIRYNAVLIPVYGVRQPDGLTFDLVFEPPVPVDDPDVMTQALNDSLEAMVRKHPGQWMWMHRRWKLAAHRG